MKALWTQESVNLPGQFWTLEGSSIKPKCLQKPHLPF